MTEAITSDSTLEHKISGIKKCLPGLAKVCDGQSLFILYLEFVFDLKESVSENDSCYIIPELRQLFEPFVIEKGIDSEDFFWLYPTCASQVTFQKLGREIPSCVTSEFERSCKALDFSVDRIEEAIDLIVSEFDFS